MRSGWAVPDVPRAQALPWGTSDTVMTRDRRHRHEDPRLGGRPHRGDAHRVGRLPHRSPSLGAAHARGEHARPPAAAAGPGDAGPRAHPLAPRLARRPSLTLDPYAPTRSWWFS